MKFTEKSNKRKRYNMELTQLLNELERLKIYLEVSKHSEKKLTISRINGTLVDVDIAIQELKIAITNNININLLTNLINIITNIDSIEFEVPCLNKTSKIISSLVEEYTS